MTPRMALCAGAMLVSMCAAPSGGHGVTEGLVRGQNAVPALVQMEADLVAALNAERVGRRLPSVRVLPELAELARAHSRDMARRNVLSHESAGGQSYHQRLVDAGISFVANGENVGRGNTTVPGLIHKAFMESPPHRENIVNPAFDAVGIGVASGSGDTFFITVDFIKSVPTRPRSEIREMMLRVLNDTRAKGRMAPIVLVEEINKLADLLAQAEAEGEKVAGVPLPRVRTSTRIVAGPDLDKLAEMIAAQDVKGFGLAGIGSAFARSPQYPSGAYAICIVLIWDGS